MPAGRAGHLRTQDPALPAAAHRRAAGLPRPPSDPAPASQLALGRPARRRLPASKRSHHPPPDAGPPTRTPPPAGAQRAMTAVAKTTPPRPRQPSQAHVSPSPRPSTRAHAAHPARPARELAHRHLLHDRGLRKLRSLIPSGRPLPACGSAATAMSLEARTVVLAVHQEPRGRFLVPEQVVCPTWPPRSTAATARAISCTCASTRQAAAEVNRAHDALAASSSAWPASGRFELMARASAGALPAAGPLHR